MKRGLVGLMVLVLVLGLAGAGLSYFTDVAVSDGNSISTGEFDIGISKDGSRYYDELRLFSFKDVAPGENHTLTFYVKNRGDYPISNISLLFNVSDKEIGKLTDSEALVDDTEYVGELSNRLVVRDFRVQMGAEELRLSNYINKTLAEINMTYITVFSGKLEPGEKLKVTIAFELSPEAGNECQTDSVEVGIKVYARQ